MNKKVLLITPFIILCLFFVGCKKNSQSSKTSKASYGIIGCTVTLRDDYEPENIEVKDVETSEIITVQNNTKVVIKSCNEDDQMFTGETEIDGKKKLISFYYGNKVSFDYETMLKVLEDAAHAKKYTYYVFENPNSFLTNEQTVTLYNKFMSFLPENFLETFTGEDDISNFRALTIKSIIQNADTSGSPEELKTTTIFHLVLEKANEKFISDYLLHIYGSWFFSCVPDEDGRIPLMRAILKENYGACKAYYTQSKNYLTIKDKNGKTFVDYARESSNQQIKNLFSIFDLNEEELVQSHLPLLVELQFAEDFNAIDFRAYEVPYTVFKRAVSNNIHFEADSKDSFISELAIQEGMLLTEGIIEDDNSSNSASGSKSDQDEKINIKIPDNIAFVFSRDENKRIDITTKLKLRESPSATAKEKGILDYGAKVTILERSENPDVIGNISDYWYKVKSDSKEGWCFGGFLVVALQNKNYNKSEITKHDTWATQIDFSENKVAIVGIDSFITAKDGKKTPVKASERIEVIKTIPAKNDMIKNFTSDFYAFDPMLSQSEHKQSYIQYPYYIVRDADNNIGIISGINLAHEDISHSDLDQNCSYFASYAQRSNSSYCVDVFEYNTETKKSRRYYFTKSEGLAVSPQVFRLGYDIKTSNYDYPSFFIVDVIYFEAESGLEQRTTKKYKLITFCNNAYSEMGAGTLYPYNVFTVTDYCAVKSHSFIGHSYSNDRGYSSSHLRINLNDKKELIAEETSTYSWSSYDGNEEGSNYTYYKWDNDSLTFYKTDEKHSDYPDER